MRYSWRNVVQVYIVLVRSPSADRSSQFKASYPSCTHSFDHCVSPPPPKSRTIVLSSSYSPLLAGVAPSFGSPLYAMSPEPPYAHVPHSSVAPSLIPLPADEHRPPIHTSLNLSDDPRLSCSIRWHSQRSFPPSPSLVISVLSFSPSPVLNPSR
jgi:hypothetical protein